MTNYQPTAEELRWLASFAGVDISWCDILTHGEPLQYFARWNPLEDWNHLRLVLEALVEKNKVTIIGGQGVKWYVILHEVTFEGKDCAEAIIKAALATRKDGE